MTAKKPTPAKKTAPQSKGKSLEQFRALHDKGYIVPKKIKEGLAKLGPDGWEYEADFAKLAGIGVADIARFRQQFEAHVVPVKMNGSSHVKNAWAGTVALANKMRDILS